mmetsp:Transcript_16447/g.42615  ORF Transcript_16447/g.42615 Transcript_16447/m.42615 type:complete len:90 (-) Transcript_16447:19-288(-)
MAPPGNAATRREFTAYDPRHQPRTMWQSTMVRVIVALLCVFFLAQMLLYRHAVRSVHAMDYSQHKQDDELDLISDLIRRAKKAYELLQY